MSIGSPCNEFFFLASSTGPMVPASEKAIVKIRYTCSRPSNDIS